jgi:DNA-binding transcriptional regulator YiaG
MAINIKRSNHVFKGHKALLGGRFVTYGEVELPSRFEEFPKSKNDFDWGIKNSNSLQLAYAMLRQVSNAEIAKENAEKFLHDTILPLNSRDWVLYSLDVLEWITNNSEIALEEDVKEQPVNVTLQNRSTHTKVKTIKKKTNVIKDVCKELGITQKALANILEVPEGTVSSWAVKNEIPRLGKKAIEFYIQSTKNQQIVDSYKNFARLLNVS